MHSSTAPYCLDLACTCHSDALYHAGVTTIHLDKAPTAEQLQQALSILLSDSPVRLTDKAHIEHKLTV